MWIPLCRRIPLPENPAAKQKRPESSGARKNQQTKSPTASGGLLIDALNSHCYKSAGKDQPQEGVEV